MEVALFWIFAALMLGFGAAVIFLKSPVSSALSLVVSFLGLAALFLLLDAFFIGIIQVLVYAGAVMVLFLFIIMLLDLKTERARKLNIPALIGGLMVVVGFIAILVKLLAGFDIAKPALARPVNDVASVGMLLFSDYNLPFQIIGVLLLVATVGVVLLSRKELK
jgi:NADH-quinone oxidoreductase subunit J